MYNYALAAVVALSLVVASTAVADLQGKNIQVQTGAVAPAFAPVAVAVETEESPAMIAVVNPASGARYPATLRDGQLVFVVDTLDPDAEVTLNVVTGERPDDSPPRVVITRRGEEAILDVHIDGTHFTSYHFGEEWKKPFLWPVNSEGGVGITRDFPMEVESTPRIARDHPHHKSLYTAYGEVNGHDLWAEGTNSGTQRSGEVTFGSGDAFGWIRAANVWVDKDNNPLIDETREYRFYATPENARLLDVSVVFKASHEEVLFSDTKEGGIVAVRMRPDISHARAIITNALGDQGEGDAWGKPAAWCDFSGEVPDVGWRGLTIFDNPGNLRHPSSWHVRNYGLMGANAFGYSDFLGREYNHGLMPENGDHTIPADTELPFNYRIYIHTGNVEEAGVAQRYQDYATPPTATLAE